MAVGIIVLKRHWQGRAGGPFCLIRHVLGAEQPNQFFHCVGPFPFPVPKLELHVESSVWELCAKVTLPQAHLYPSCSVVFWGNGIHMQSKSYTIGKAPVGLCGV